MGDSESTARKSPWIRGVVTGLALSLALAVAVTLRDWQLNPSRLFHGNGSTHWNVVFETAWSWFWPLALAAVPLSTLAFLLLSRRQPADDQGVQT